MEGHIVSFTYDKEDITLKTDQMLFILAGHFKDLYSSTNTPPKPSIGFTNTTPTSPNQPLRDVSSKDLERCGLFKEFIGRIAIRVVLEPVNHQMLLDALKQELKIFQEDFSAHGSALEVEEEAQETLIDQAMQEGTGMHAIKTLLTQVITPLRFFMQEWRGYRCIITIDTLNGSAPTRYPLSPPDD